MNKTTILKLEELSNEKDLQTAFTAKLALKILENLKYKDDFFVLIDCCEESNTCVDIIMKLNGAWSEFDYQDLNFIGVSFCDKYYRYYAGLEKKLFLATGENQDDIDAEYRKQGYDYLSKKYSWLFCNIENKKGIWSGYSNEKEMHLYKSLDISEMAVDEITKKALYDLNEIYDRMIDRC